MTTTRHAAEHEPVARVLPMLSVPHLDREFDYLVSADQSDDAQPGVRVRVRFHGRLVDGFVLERRSDTDHVGNVSPVFAPVLGQGMAQRISSGGWVFAIRSPGVPSVPASLARPCYGAGEPDGSYLDATSTSREVSGGLFEPGDQGQSVAAG